MYIVYFSSGLSKINDISTKYEIRELLFFLDLLD